MAEVSPVAVVLANAGVKLAAVEHTRAHVVLVAGLTLVLKKHASPDGSVL